MHRPKIIDHYEIQHLQSCEQFDLAYECCEKKATHKNYCNVDELPEMIQEETLRQFIKIRCDLTVLIEIPTSDGVRCGSGFIQKIEFIENAPCLCPKCKDNAVIGYGKVTLSTALHVVEEDNDAAKCKVRLFYDNENSEISIIYGLSSHSRDEDEDWCAVVCVTHDNELLKSLTNALNQHWTLGRKLKEQHQDENSNEVVVIAHPHGGPKKISFGKGKMCDFAKEVRDDQLWCYYSYDATTCDGSSGGPVYVMGRWNDGFGYWFGHAHNHCGIDNRSDSSSTVGVDSTYDQVTKSFSTINMNKKENQKLSDTIQQEFSNTSQTVTVIDKMKVNKVDQSHTSTYIDNYRSDIVNSSHTLI